MNLFYQRTYLVLGMFFIFVGTYSGLELGPGTLDLSLGYNSNKTELGDKINTPAPIASSGAELFDRKEQSRLISARPASKIILGLNYTMGALKVGLNNTQFGEVKWQHASDESMDQTFSAKLVTDLNLNYVFTNNLSLNATASSESILITSLPLSLPLI